MELVVVIAVIGILAAIAIPSMAAFSDRYRLVRVTNEYQMSVNLTRVQAITENRPMRIVHYADDDYHDNSDTTICQWDVQGLNQAAGGWETIPFDGNQGYPNNYGQTGWHDYSNTASPKYTKHISMQDTGGIDETGSSFQYNTRGFLDSWTAGASGVAGCVKVTSFQNKNGDAYAYRRVCIDNAGIARLINQG